jgi:hypothetical protein
VSFFLEGVSVIADEAADSARDLFAIVTKDRNRLLGADNATVMSIRLLERLPQKPVVTIPGVAEDLETTKPTAAKAVAILEELGILVQATERRRDRVFQYAAYLEKLKVGTELE